jgi:hypothetical protein
MDVGAIKGNQPCPLGFCLRPVGPKGPKGLNDGSRGIHSPVNDTKYPHVTYVTWGEFGIPSVG